MALIMAAGWSYEEESLIYARSNSRGSGTIPTIGAVALRGSGPFVVEVPATCRISQALNCVGVELRMTSRYCCYCKLRCSVFTTVDHMQIVHVREAGLRGTDHVETGELATSLQGNTIYIFKSQTTPHQKLQWQTVVITT